MKSSSSIGLILNILYQLIVLVLILVIVIISLIAFANFGTLNQEYKNVFSSITKSINSNNPYYEATLDYDEQEYNIVFKGKYLYVYNCQYQSLGNNPAFYFIQNNSYYTRALADCYLVYEGIINKNYKVIIKDISNNQQIVNIDQVFQDETNLKSISGTQEVNLGNYGSLSDYFLCDTGSLTYDILYGLQTAGTLGIYNLYQEYQISSEIQNINVNGENVYAVSEKYFASSCDISQNTQIIVEDKDGTYEIIFEME